MKILIAATLLISFGFTGRDQVERRQLNAMTTIYAFNHDMAAEKYDNSDHVSVSDLAGNWEITNSYFTIMSEEMKTSFQLEGRKYQFNEDGSGIMDNSAFGYDKKDISWSISSDGMEFIEGEERFRVRIVGDSMEWLAQADEDYIYFVLVRE